MDANTSADGAANVSTETATELVPESPSETSPDLYEKTSAPPVNMEDVTPKGSINIQPRKDLMEVIAGEMENMNIPSKMIIFIMDQLKNIKHEPRGRRYFYQKVFLNV